jgi:aspartate dehydrogenase
VNRAASRKRQERPLRVGMLGVGAMGGTLVRLLQDGGVTGCSLAGTIRSSTRPDATDVLIDLDVLVEAAGAAAARAWVPPAVAAGIDVVLCSCGVLADPLFVDQLTGGGPERGRLLVPSGAIGGLDLFAAAARASRSPSSLGLVPAQANRNDAPNRADDNEILIDAAQVVLTTTKNPTAFGVSCDEPVEVFRGCAREAALAHPKTANVAVALALATTGMDAVTVVMVADPLVTRSQHVITMTSPMGEYEISVTNTVAPDSGGRTSAVTAWSVVTLLEALATGYGAGLPIDLSLLDSRPDHQREDVR